MTTTGTVLRAALALVVVVVVVRVRVVVVVVVVVRVMVARVAKAAVPVLQYLRPV